MNWEAIGAVAELLGSVAVVVTLIFLAAQLRSNSSMIRNSSLQSQATAMSEWARQLTLDPALYEIYRQGLRDDSTLSREDRGRFDMILVQVFQSIAVLHQQYLNGGMDKESWQANLRTMGVTLNTSGGKASWNRQKSMLDERFQSEVARHFDLNP